MAIVGMGGLLEAACCTEQSCETMNAMARMKGNRGVNGERLPGTPFDLPIAGAAGRLAPPREREVAQKRRFVAGRRRTRLMLVVGVLAILAIVGVAILGYLKSQEKDSPIVRDRVPAGAATAPAAAPDSTSSNTNPSPVDAAAAATPATPANSATTTPTASPSPVATATASPLPATATPAGPPSVRVKYTVAAGESCDLIRQKFRFPANTFEDFYLAMGRISGRTPANQCAFSPGDVICIPTANDLAQLGSLVRDTACLLGTGP